MSVVRMRSRLVNFIFSLYGLNFYMRDTDPQKRFAFRQ